MVNISKDNLLDSFKCETDQSTKTNCCKGHDTATLDDKITEIFTLLSSNKNIFIADEARSKSLVYKIIAGSINKIQIVTDFDRTLSCHTRLNRETGITCYQCLMSYKDNVYHMEEKHDEISKTFKYIEFDHSLSTEERIPHMIEWWSTTNAMITASKIRRTDVHEASLNSSLEIRDGFIEFIKHVHSYDIPVLVASAGIGDIVKFRLHDELDGLKGIHIASNFLIFDENDTVSGFTDPMIHSFNKHVIADLSQDYFDQHKTRTNFILFGDSIGDVDVIKNVPPTVNILKVGFFNFDESSMLMEYLEVFDIVLMDATSMRQLLPFFQFIINHSYSVENTFET